MQRNGRAIEGTHARLDDLALGSLVVALREAPKPSPIFAFVKSSFFLRWAPLFEKWAHMLHFRALNL
jgi:hypothetical protein